LPLFSGAADDAVPCEAPVALSPMRLGEHVVDDYRSLSLSLKAHPVAFLRGDLKTLSVVEAGRLPEIRSGQRISVAGLVLVRQRPGTAQGVIFATLEDETGVANVIIWPKIFERHRPIVLGARLLLVRGRLQSEQGVIHVVAERLQDLSPLLSKLADQEIGRHGVARADEVCRPVDEQRQKVKPKSRLTRTSAADPALAVELKNVKQTATSAMPKGRNFH
jgi:DNA polymerase III alpha subunit